MPTQSELSCREVCSSKGLICQPFNMKSEIEIFHMFKSFGIECKDIIRSIGTTKDGYNITFDTRNKHCGIQKIGQYQDTCNISSSIDGTVLSLCNCLYEGTLIFSMACQSLTTFSSEKIFVTLYKTLL